PHPAEPTRPASGLLSSSATAQVQVTSSPVDQAPVARLDVSPPSGQAPLPVTADASTSTDTDATPIATYTFDFGDGSAVVGPQTSSSAQHTYSSAGTYTVKVTVADTGGLSSSATAQVQVTSSPVDQAPVARLAVSPTARQTTRPITT